MSINFLESKGKRDELYNGDYAGIIKSVADPLEKSRVRVEVLPMFKGLATTDLPWAIVIQNALFGVPPVNMWVAVKFRDGDIYSPIVYGPIQAFSV